MITQMAERPPYVQFETRPVEDRDASIREGRYIAKNVNVALITPAGSKDTVERLAEDWLREVRLRATRNPPTINPQHASYFEECYARWQKDNTLPEDGTPIKGWAVITPAEQVNIISANVRTVEDLAVLNESGLQRIGMGARNLQERAKAWLKSATDHGAGACEIANLKTQNEELLARIASLEARLGGAKPDAKAIARERKAAWRARQRTTDAEAVVS